MLTASSPSEQSKAVITFDYFMPGGSGVTGLTALRVLDMALPQLITALSTSQKSFRIGGL